MARTEQNHHTMKLNRRSFIASALLLSPTTWALVGHLNSQNQVMLNKEQSALFRQWFAAIVRQQLKQGPSNRWTHRDCAGLIRFAVFETLREHDTKWRAASGFELAQLPAELNLNAAQKNLKNEWITIEGNKSAYVSALALIQKNSVFVSKNMNQAQIGDLLFFDQGDAQHLMIWLGNLIAYHTGTVTKTDNGLRAVLIPELLNWKDTRWRINQNNPNFIGIYRLGFLSR
ncbi:DUF1175 family protein [Neisseria sp. Ec49-e6-T10]|uniref:DUF1175 family protein n=1 Tax=Neisseria sp. Ec49-e6-T10 TaxID=3140744 RepID=UPI003EBD724D